MWPDLRAEEAQKLGRPWIGAAEGTQMCAAGWIVVDVLAVLAPRLLPFGNLQADTRVRRLHLIDGRTAEPDRLSLARVAHADREEMVPAGCVIVGVFLV